MNKKLVVALSAAILGFIAFEYFSTASKITLPNHNPRIGLIIPLTNPALTKIVEGFTTRMKAISGSPCEFIIRDAQGDQNVQQPAIIDEMLRKNVDIIVPIGTLCTQMTVQKAPNTAIVALAAAPSSLASPTHMATGVHDEIEASRTFAFINSVIPNLSKVAIIATHNEKTIPELHAFRNEAMKHGATVQIIYIQTPSDIYLATQSIDKDAQCIHILKDILVARSIATINQMARERGIPVITCDEGSVEHGAACALGVSEASIGEAGADLALKILTGTKPGDIPVKALESLAIFVNEEACRTQKAPLASIFSYAKNMGYAVVTTRGDV